MIRALRLAHGDFLERVRRHGFLVTLGFTAWAAHGALPPLGSSYVTTKIGDGRPLYNSAGVASIVAVFTGVFLSLIGFYLVKNSVERDRSTGVGEVLCATRMSRGTYVLSKVISNAAVLLVIAAVMLVVAVAMQLVLGEDRQLRPAALTGPFLLLTAPTMILVAAVAVLFEMVPILRRGLGNAAYFFLFMGVMSAGVLVESGRLPLADPIGMGIVLPSMEKACAAQDPTYRPGSGNISVGINATPAARHIRPFRWEGVRWTPTDVGLRFVWLVAAGLLTFISALLFDRFRNAGAPAVRRSDKKRSGPITAVTLDGAAVVRSPAPQVSASNLTVAPRSLQFLPMLRAELKLMTRGQNRWWYGIAVVLVVVTLFVPVAGVRAAMLPFLGIWPILLWSSMGWRECRHGTDAVLFSAPRPLARQLLAAWLAGVAVSALMLAPACARLAISGDPGALLAWAAGTLFIPSFALASGVWTGSGKLFEVVHLMLWYTGPLNHVGFLDFLGVVPGAEGPRAAFLALALALLAIAYLGRSRQVRR